jgi:hypothetical protein
MQKEIFKDIPNYEGFYQVSNMGNVKSIPRLNDNGKRKCISKERILKHCKDIGGYYQVGLHKESKVKTINIHILVAMVFLGHTPDGTHKIVVDHINNIKTDNRVENLQLISNRENCSKDKKNGSSQYTGVYWDKNLKKWKACIYTDGKLKHLGLFTDEYEAHLEYQRALNEILLIN